MKQLTIKLMAMLCIALGTLASTTATVQADDVSFSIVNDPTDWPWIGRTHTPGVLQGILHGLVNNATSIPTAVTLIGDYSSLGMTSNSITAWDVTNGAGVTLSGGVVTAADFLGNFTDPSIGGMQFRLNSTAGEDRNVLHWNGSSGPVVGRGNADGFGGATYGAVIPEPSSAALVLMGVAGVLVRVRGKRAGLNR